MLVAVSINSDVLLFVKTNIPLNIIVSFLLLLVFAKEQSKNLRILLIAII